MKSTGIVVEYNPFHNGHDYHFKQAKEAAGADIVIAVMSGNFLQRGEPSLVSKWARTKMALEAEIDLVVELPYAFAVQQAEIFARGAIGILSALGCSSFCFGSESGKIKDFENTLNGLEEHKEAFEANVQKLIKTGISYPSAMAESFKLLPGQNEMVDLSKPNNILGFQYMKANKETKANMSPLTISRKNANYHDETFASESIASATSIRKALFESGRELSDIKPFLPLASYLKLLEYKRDFQRFHEWNLYWPFLQYQLMTMESSELARLYEMEEGIQFRLKKAAAESDNFYSFISRVKTKRYTWTRIQRICVHILTHTYREEISMRCVSPEYIRLLGMSSRGREYLNIVKKDLPLPLISRAAAAEPSLIHLDIKASNVYAHALLEPQRTRLMKMEYSQPPLFQDSNTK